MLSMDPATQERTSAPSLTLATGPSAAAGLPIWIVVGLLWCGSLAVGIAETRRLVRVEQALGAVGAEGRSVEVVARGALRATVCGRQKAPEGAALVVRDRQGGAVLERVSLASYRALRPKCSAGQWESLGGRRVWATVEGLAPGDAPSLRRGGALGTRTALPVLGMLLALGVFALRGPRAGGTESQAATGGWLRGPWGFAAALGVFVVSNLVGPVPLVLLGRDAVGVVVGTVAQHGLLAVLSGWLLVRDRGGPWRRAMGWGSLRRGEVFGALATGVGLLGLAALVTRFIDDPAATPMGQALEEVPLRYAVALTALLAPVSEELFFRGLLFRILEPRGLGAHAWRRWGWWVPILGQAVIFAGAHAMQLRGALVGLVPILAVGLATGAWRARTGTLAAPWIVHAIYNGILVMSVFASA